MPLAALVLRCFAERLFAKAQTYTMQGRPERVYIDKVRVGAQNGRSLAPFFDARSMATKARILATNGRPKFSPDERDNRGGSRRLASAVLIYGGSKRRFGYNFLSGRWKF
jgi:hypothetical protein